MQLHLQQAIIIKLPNISASLPQLNEAVNELRKKGYEDLHTYAEALKEANEENQGNEGNVDSAKSRFDRVLGSVVNPVLKEGNSDRRVATPVKTHSQKHPHRMMKRLT